MGCGAIVSIRAADPIYGEEESSKSAKSRARMHLGNLRKTAALPRHAAAARAQV